MEKEENSLDIYKRERNDHHWWFLVPALILFVLGGSLLFIDGLPKWASAISSISIACGGVFLGILANTVTGSFGAEKNEWLPLAESSCKQLLKMRIGIARYLEKETGDNSFCSSISDDSVDKPLIKKHCETVDMKLRDIDGDLGCVYSDWINFINTNCKQGECADIWDRIHSIYPN